MTLTPSRWRSSSCGLGGEHEEMRDIDGHLVDRGGRAVRISTRSSLSGGAIAIRWPEKYML